MIALPNGMRLLVGRDLGEPERFRDLVRSSLMLALGIMGVGALLIWFFVGRRALKRIDEVSRASQRIMDGDLTGDCRSMVPVTSLTVSQAISMSCLGEFLNSMKA